MTLTYYEFVFHITLGVTDTVMKQSRSPEVAAIMRSVARKSALENVAFLFVGCGLIGGGIQLSGVITRSLSIEPSNTITTMLILALLATEAFLIWSFSTGKTAWSDGLKTVVPFSRFLQLGSKSRALAPNIDQATQMAILDHLRSINDRADVTEVLVGLLADEGDVSDRVLIKTYAPKSDSDQWTSLLSADGQQQISRYKYDVDGIKRNVRSILFIWD